MGISVMPLRSIEVTEDEMPLNILEFLGRRPAGASIGILDGDLIFRRLPDGRYVAIMAEIEGEYEARQRLVGLVSGEPEEEFVPPDLGPNEGWKDIADRNEDRRENYDLDFAIQGATWGFRFQDRSKS